jgi:putative endonuclease
VYHPYVLESQSDGNLYTGITSDVERRLREHNAGRVQSTKRRRPLHLIYVEDFSSRSEAFARESYFKTPEGGALKQRLVAQRRLKTRPAR